MKGSESSLGRVLCDRGHRAPGLTQSNLAGSGGETVPQLSAYMYTNTAV